MSLRNFVLQRTKQLLTGLRWLELKIQSTSGCQPHWTKIYSLNLPQKKMLFRTNENDRAQMVINSRKDLGRLTKWSGPVTDKATSVVKAIEIVLKNTEFISTEKMDMTGKVLKWKLYVFTRNIEPINLEIRHDGKQWKVNVADIEAVLSLWLFAAAERERIAMDDKLDVDAWLRSGDASRGDSMRLLGESNAISRRDMKWWAGSGNNRIIEVSSPSDDRKIIELRLHRVVGYSGYKIRGEDEKDERKKGGKCQYQIHAVSDNNNNMPEIKVLPANHC